MGNRFRKDYGVFCCPHVFKSERPVLKVVRDTDGSWQFLCGQQDDNLSAPPHLVGVGHLLGRDPSLEEMANLKIASGAKRNSISLDWSYFDLE